MRSGDVVAKYQLRKRLGIGGMGEVWSAVHSGTEREFAMKFMHAQVAASESSRQRFAREAKASARINHPNIIDVFDVGECEDGALYLVMELLDGMALADALHATPPLSVRDFLAIMLDTAKALAAAHVAGIIHRDVKPANIYLHKDRATGLAYAKVLDFGISKFSSGDDASTTKTSSVLGSPRYMSPEQTRSAALTDRRADIWALGVVMFEALTGRWPHEGDSFSSLVVAIATEPPHSIDEFAPHLPEDLRALVRDCLKPLEQRIQHTAEVVARLERVVSNGDLAAVPLPRPRNATEGGSTTGGLRVRTPPPLTGSGSNRAAEPAPARGYAFAPQPTSSDPGSAAPHAGGVGSGSFPAVQRAVGLGSGSFPGYAGPPQSGAWGPEASGAHTASAPLPQGGVVQGGTLPYPPAVRPDGLSSSVSMNVETVALTSSGLDFGSSQPSFRTVPLPVAPPQAMPPRSQYGGMLGVLAAVLGVLALGIGALVISAARTTAVATPTAGANSPTVSATVSATAAPTPPEPTTAAPTPPEPTTQVPAPTASAATRPSATATVAAPLPPKPIKAGPGPARPVPTKKSKVEGLGSGL